jgi:chaperone required for assembly of F1-ATPase
MFPPTVQPLELPKRFYKTVSTAAAEGGFAVKLDARTPKTPGGKALVAPTQGLAELIAAEWDAQDPCVNLAAMPATRLAHTAIDKVPAVHGEAAAEFARYAESDLVCYFADGPEALVRRQEAGWTPILRWAEDQLGLTLHRAEGIIHRDQPPETLAKVRELAATQNDFVLAGLTFGAALTGSAVLTLALRLGRIDGAEAFELFRLDEDFQSDQWGVDEEAAQRAAALRAETLMLERWFRALD